MQLRYWADQIMANLLFLAAKTDGRLSNNFTGSVCGGREQAGDAEPLAAPRQHLLLARCMGQAALVPHLTSAEASGIL